MTNTAEILAEWLYRHAEAGTKDIIHSLGNPNTPAILRPLAADGDAHVARVVFPGLMITGQLMFQIAGQTTCDGELTTATLEYLRDNGKQETAQVMHNTLALCIDQQKVNGQSIDLNLPLLLETALATDLEAPSIEGRAERVRLLKELLFVAMADWWARPPGLARC